MYNFDSSQELTESVKRVIADFYPGEDIRSRGIRENPLTILGGLAVLHSAEKTVIREKRRIDLTDEGDK